MRDRTGTTAKIKGGGAVGQLADSGAAGHVAPLRAVALRARRRQVSRPASAGRWYLPSRCADGRACKDRAWPVLRAGHLSPRKITVEGAPSGRVSDGTPRHP